MPGWTNRAFLNAFAAAAVCAVTSAVSLAQDMPPSAITAQIIPPAPNATAEPPQAAAQPAPDQPASAMRSSTNWSRRSRFIPIRY
jgi:hypothetical protein